MARKGQSLLFVCSSCRHQLTKKSLRPTRAFSITSQRSRSIPSFTPTSSPELDELFLNFREKVFTPFALAQHHRDLIYKKSRHHILLNDPGVTVTLSNDEEIRLMPMEPREKPNKVKSLNRLADLLGQTKDVEGWTNLPAFLEGMEMAKEEYPDTWIEKITRRANLVGKTGVIKLCAEMVKKTGASLANPAMTQELMIGYHMQAVQGGFAGEALERSWKSAEQVSLMMEDKLHCAGKLKEGQRDMRKDPIVLGVLLELAAKTAVNANEGEDVHGKVASLVVKTLACTKDEPWTLPSPGGPEHKTSSLLTRWIPLWNGMRAALDVDGISSSPKAGELRSRCNSLEKAIHTAEKRIEAWWKKDSKPRSLKMLEEIRQQQHQARHD